MRIVSLPNRVYLDIWMHWASPKDIILDEVFIASPKRQYLGALIPTIPA